MLNKIQRENENIITELLATNKRIEMYLKANPDIAFVEQVKEGAIFFDLIKYKTAQYKAPAFERFLTEGIGWEKIHASEDRGDFIINGEYVELKTSFTNQAMNLNLRQIRLWQNVGKYICIFVDDKNDINNSYLFELTKEEMEQEVKLLGGYTHGTKGANELNVNREYSITIKIREGNANFERWKKNYLNNSLWETILRGFN